MLQHELPYKHDNFDYNMAKLNVTLIYLDAQYIDLKFYSISELSFDELKQKFKIQKIITRKHVLKWRSWGNALPSMHCVQSNIRMFGCLVRAQAVESESWVFGRVGSRVRMNSLKYYLNT